MATSMQQAFRDLIPGAIGSDFAADLVSIADEQDDDLDYVEQLLGTSMTQEFVWDELELFGLPAYQASQAELEAEENANLVEVEVTVIGGDYYVV